ACQHAEDLAFIFFGFAKSFLPEKGVVLHADQTSVPLERELFNEVAVRRDHRHIASCVLNYSPVLNDDQEVARVLGRHDRLKVVRTMLIEIMIFQHRHVRFAQDLYLNFSRFLKRIEVLDSFWFILLADRKIGEDHPLELCFDFFSQPRENDRTEWKV